MSVININKFEAAHHRWRILKINWKDMISNKVVVRERTGQDRHLGVNHKRTSTQMVWSRISDGFQWNSTPSDGLDSSGLQKEERTPKSVVDFNNKNDLDLHGLTWDEALDLTKGSFGMERLYCPMCFYSTRKD